MKRNHNFIIVRGEIYIPSEVEIQKINLKLVETRYRIKFKEKILNQNIFFFNLIEADENVHDILTMLKIIFFKNSNLKTKSYITQRLRDEELFNLETDNYTENLILKGNGIKNISIITQKFPNIVSLDISNNLITNLHEFIAIITKHEKLKHVIFTGNPIQSMLERYFNKCQSINQLFFKHSASNASLEKIVFFQEPTFDNLFEVICEKFDNFLATENITEFIETKTINLTQNEDIINLLKSLTKCCQSRYMSVQNKFNTFNELIDSMFKLILANIAKLQLEKRNAKNEDSLNRNLEVMKMNIRILEESLQNKENQINSLKNYVEVLTKINNVQDEKSTILHSSRFDKLSES